MGFLVEPWKIYLVMYPSSTYCYIRDDGTH